MCVGTEKYYRDYMRTGIYAGIHSSFFEETNEAPIAEHKLKHIWMLITKYLKSVGKDLLAEEKERDKKDQESKLERLEGTQCDTGTDSNECIVITWKGLQKITLDLGQVGACELVCSTLPCIASWVEPICSRQRLSRRGCRS